MTVESDGAGQERGGTVVFRGSFHRLRRERHYDLAPGPAPKPGNRSGATDPSTVKRPANVAGFLALAHHIQYLIDTGEIADYAEVARRLHWTRARVSQVMDLLLLAPDIQEKVLCLQAGTHVSERALRAVVSHEDWREQRSIWCALERQAA